MLQQNEPDDFVIATGKQYSVKDFINCAAKNLDMVLEWQGIGLKEVGLLNGKEIIKVDPRYFRPAEVENLLGDPTKAKEKLNWFPRISFENLVREMIEEDLKKQKMKKILKVDSL